MKILVLGSTGMIGHVVYNYLKEKKYDVYTTTRKLDDENYLDIVETPNGIKKYIEKIKPDYVVNCIGILNKQAEEHKLWAIIANAYLPNYLNELSDNYNFKLIHISTDCVFDGKKGSYKEDSIPDAESFYGKTKALGEFKSTKNCILRTSTIGPELKQGIGLFLWLMNQEGEISGFTKVPWTGITTIQVAKSVEKSINNDLTGLYNVVNGKTISKYELLKLIAKEFNKSIKINPNDTFVSNKSLVKSERFDFEIPSYEDMIKEMKEWVINHIDLYPNLKKYIGEK